ncbi:hypothetical protein B0H16DRAFT_1769549 [Mycena metata]|uniref:Indoleamine 2,3-dioxygenase n=1 Tax=Mycena metata TaxID=1033252 RepID=A0AAD7I1Q9_9AGAR|nr:hypothetical protein B0H16DRAFT_1769549 [Mycena metata]
MTGLTIHPRRALHELISKGGGGRWPPTATFQDSWPLSLKPYHRVFLAIAQLVSVSSASLDDGENRALIDQSRGSLMAALRDNVDSEAVRRTLDAGSDALGVSGWLGFFACIAYLRHAYRWGISPIVREAQHETGLSFPPQLNTPWAALQHVFGFISPGGNLTSNIYCAFNARRDLEYSFTVGMSTVHRETERWNATLFLEMECKAAPMYDLMVVSIEAIEIGSATATLQALKSVNGHLKEIFKYFFDNLTDSNVSQELWMAYVQGPHGWALDGIDGVSGGQSLVIRTVDAFLGIRPFPTPEIESLHIPREQRTWLNALRAYDIRTAAKTMNDTSVEMELETMVKHLRVWRMGHMKRMVSYEGVPRPERQNMTAGKSLVAIEVAPDESAMVEHLRQQLALRLAQTK